MALLEKSGAISGMLEETKCTQCAVRQEEDATKLSRWACPTVITKERDAVRSQECSSETLVRSSVVCERLVQAECDMKRGRYWLDEAESLFLSRPRYVATYVRECWQTLVWERGSMRTTTESTATKDECIFHEGLPRTAPAREQVAAGKGDASNQEGSAADLKNDDIANSIQAQISVEDARVTLRSRRWCEVSEDNLPIVPSKCGWADGKGSSRRRGGSRSSRYRDGSK